MKPWIGGIIAAVLSRLRNRGSGTDVVLEGGTLIDGTGSAPIADAVVVIQGFAHQSRRQKGTGLRSSGRQR